MTGRDIVKFILHNNLLDKTCTLQNTTLRCSDYLPTDEEIRYLLRDDRLYRVGIVESDEIYLLESGDIGSVDMSTLKVADSCTAGSWPQYNTYNDTFSQWLKSLSDESAVIHVIVEYANEDSNFVRNCASFNKMMSYLESKEAGDEILHSAEVAWMQYMRECRNIGG